VKVEKEHFLQILKIVFIFNDEQFIVIDVILDEQFKLIDFSDDELIDGFSAVGE
jgi:hypothetical protein